MPLLYIEMRRFRDSEFRQFSDYEIGQNVKLAEKIQRQVDDKADPLHDLRVNVNDTIVEISPTVHNENFQQGTLVGAYVSAVAQIVDEYVPILADTEIVGTEPVENGTRYTVNVDSPLKSQARFRAMMESGTGWTSYITDRYDMEEPEAIKKRLTRDTWQVEITVLD